ncbi:MULTISPECIES: metallophosphoesterase [Gilliamella]|nr:MULTISPECIES: metallophosphoesterase [Gilliamella]NUF27131.1 metallophosphoesterase [Gilliamella sp. ESL0254]
MAINPKIVHYQVKIDKPAKVEHLRIVQLSDIHLNELTTNRFIQQMVDKVNKLNADFVVITGDTLDKYLKPFTQNGFDKQFQQLRSKYGTYIIFGNHEYLATNQENNREEDIVNAFRQAGMKVLKDDIIYFDDIGVTLVGRDDFSSFRYNVNRASLSDLIMFTNTDSPVILLDHQPKDLNEPEKLGVDLMISGHTHAGQIFPINIIEKLMYKNTYGFYRKEDDHFNSIVSSGYGFWGPPIRLMTRSEIVVIDIVFNKNTHNE